MEVVNLRHIVITFVNVTIYNYNMLKKKGCQERMTKPGVVVCACNPITPEGEAEG
jgi:hypothetical protein